MTITTAEKALMSLPTPLTVSDEYIRQREPLEMVRVSAGLHRQVWVGGTGIFVDVHVENNTKKPIRRLELQLERDILCYKHVRCHSDLSTISFQLTRILDCRNHGTSHQPSSSV
jgi:hypothetical protein